MFKSVHQRNWFAFFMDYTFFGLGLVFVNANTILAAFTATLTTSKVIVGLTPAIWYGSWLIPQLFAARYLARQPRKFGYMIWGSIIGRPAFWLLALLLVSGVITGDKTVLLIVFFVSIAWFSGIDAFVAVAFFDILGRALDSKARAQVASSSVIVNSLIAIGAGALVGYLFSSNGPNYPINFAITFTLGGVCFFISLAGLIFVVEPHESAAQTQVHQKDSSLTPLWNDKIFIRANVVRVLGGLSGLAIPFYVLHATQEAQIEPQIIGGFAAVGSIGAALAGIVFGKVAEKFGAHRVFQISTWLSLLPPLIGLGLTLTRATAASAWVYIVCYLIIGMIEGSVSIGFFNYIIDLAPAATRTTYIGLTNTIGGLLILPPIIGGWILDSSSYLILFSITLLGVAAAGVAAFGLKSAHSRAEI
jgi:MFS family permease